MRFLSAADLAAAFAFPDLVETLRGAFRRGAIVPVRHHHAIALAGEPDATLLLMPAWDDRSTGTVAEAGHLGVKIVSVYPGNAARGMPSVSGTYLLMDGRTGEPLAAIDGQALTLWRTAAASALAASYLARPEAARLAMVGAGALAPYLIEAHAGVRPIAEVSIWNRSRERAEKLAARLAGKPYRVEVSNDLARTVRSADIVCCATLSSEPLVCGAWLKAGAHLDLVGAFTPQMRESDDDAVERACLYVDTRDGALKEAGDIVQPLAAGIISRADIVGDLSDLCRGEAPGRRADEEITLFKSVGTALEDLAAAVHAIRRLGGSKP
jgi:ornithine cyclodeaminase